ncbi:MAG TPA: rhodanese-like domain-containing protein, partial [Bacillota bacterium]|nr:rhodanese-like domain-containing protein [Bacillota bacterium]
VLLPNTEIESLAEEILPDKNATILIYCKSGKKSAEAAEKLVKMGYTKVYDFGGIEDWPYQTVK